MQQAVAYCLFRLCFKLILTLTRLHVSVSARQPTASTAAAAQPKQLPVAPLRPALFRRRFPQRPNLRLILKLQLQHPA